MPQVNNQDRKPVFFVYNGIDKNITWNAASILKT